jgi:hypothetical protein
MRGVCQVDEVPYFDGWDAKPFDSSRMPESNARNYLYSLFCGQLVNNLIDVSVRKI